MAAAADHVAGDVGHAALRGLLLRAGVEAGAGWVGDGGGLRGDVYELSDCVGERDAGGVAGAEPEQPHAERDFEEFESVAAGSIKRV